MVEYCVDSSGVCSDGKAYRALVRNQAQLAYPSVGAWLEGSGPAPAKVAANAALAAQLKLPDKATQQLVNSRFQHGALDLETVETHRSCFRIKPSTSQISKKTAPLRSLKSSWSQQTGLSLACLRMPGLRSHSPHRSYSQALGIASSNWPRALAPSFPAEPDSKALNEFLLAQKQKDPDHFSDLSLAVVKLMGPGEYVLVKPHVVSPGHFGLAVQDYTHSTAPNRRFPDVVMQRVLKAHVQSAPALQ